jgi:hypothetical protein
MLFVIALVLMALMFPRQYVGISIVAVGVVMVGKGVWAYFSVKLNPRLLDPGVLEN